MTTPEHTIEALCQRSRDISLEKGWLNSDGTDPRPFYTVIGLFHTELSEAFEDARNNKRPSEIWYEVNKKYSVTDSRCDASMRAEMLENGAEVGDFKPCGIPVELADFAIRVCQWAGSAGAGAELSRLVRVTQEVTTRESLRVETIEELVTQLHADVSMSFVAKKFIEAGKAQDLTSIGLPSEPMNYLASALYTVFTFCEKNHIDLWGAIDEKEAFNRTRPIRHGWKKH